MGVRVVLRINDDGPVRLLQLDRPQSRNALSSELVRALHDALGEADRDPLVSVVLLHGSDPAFCAGVDLKEATRHGAAYFDTFLAYNCVALVGELATPVVGAVNGAAFTAGLELALGCDFLIASERAVFADTHVRSGVLPGGGLAARLPRVVGQQRARRMSMTAEVLDATEALRVGLVTEVVPHADLLARALTLSHAVASMPRDLILPLKQMYVRSDAGLQAALAAELTAATAHRIDYSALEGLLHRPRGAWLPSGSADPQETLGIPPGSTP